MCEGLPVESALCERDDYVRHVYEESESLAKIQRWLQMADSALENEQTSERKRPA